MNMNNCLFCRILKGEIPCFKIYEDHETLVFLDPAQDVDGHMIAIPKEHCSSILDCSEKSLKSLFKTIQVVSNHIVDNCSHNGVNLLNASGKCAGQSIHHFHMHIIPRKEHDGIDAWPSMNNHKRTLEEMQKELDMRSQYEY